MVLFLIVIAVSGSLAIVGRESERYKWLLYIFKPLTMILIITMGFFLNDDYERLYFILIIAGLIFGLLGDVFLMFSEHHFSKGLLSFLVGHLFYTAAFYFYSNSLNLILMIAGAIIGFIIPKYISKIPGKYRSALAIYGAILFAMLLTAANTSFTSGNYFILLGALLFTISDIILALNKFLHEFYPAHLIILSTYFCAQTLIVLSI